MLILVEKAIQTGPTSPDKTNVLCQWTIPEGRRVDATVKPVRDLFSKNQRTQSLNLN